MSEISKRRLAFACCAAMALGFVGCGDDGAGSASDSRKTCGDEVCTPSQTCVENHCVENDTLDPCAKCDSETQICEDGVCKDKPEDDPCAKCDPATQICEDGVCKDKPEDPCAKCTEAQKCVEGVCKDLCGSEVCADDMICNPDTQKCEKPVNPCDECTDKQECVNFECVDVDPCANKTCPDNQRCDSTQDGKCVDIDPCENVPCSAGLSCIKGHCVEDACIENGEEKVCENNQVCSAGECVPGGCAGVKCDEGWQCMSFPCDENSSSAECQNGYRGQCVETICIDYFCDEGRSCKGGKCVDNECLDMTCEEGQICSKGNCTYEICLTKDPCSAGKTCDEDGECVFIVDPAIALDEPEDKTTDEAGKSLSLTLHLNNAPTADVHVSCEVVTESPNKEVDAACEEIVFNADNWQLEQTIVVTGVDDYLKDGDQVYKLKVTTVSEDADFNELVAESVELTNIDKTTPGIVVSETALTTYEDQAQEAASFSIVLTSIPSADVNLTLSSSNPNEGVATPTTLKFTKDNWNEPHVVTVKGVDDNAHDGNKNYTIFFSPSESNDEDYNEKQLTPIKVTNVDNDVAGLSVNLPEAFVLLEGQTMPLLVRLNTLPKKDVKITMNVDDKTEAEFEEAEVTLTPENWNTGIEIHLKGVADSVIDGDQPVKVTFKVESEDEDYNFDAIDFEGTVQDTDTAEVIYNMGDLPIVKEGDSGFVTMSVSLSSKPTKDVTVALSVTDDSELKLNKKTLTFKPNYWDIGQDVLVSSVDDDIVDGNIKSNVVMKATSGDANFNNKVTEVEFMTVDDDEAGFVISSNAASFPENSGSTTSMTIALKAQPTADVKVAVTSTDASELAVTSASSITFTTKNWKTPQTVTVKVVDDNIADGTQTAQVKFVASSSDKNFNGVTDYSAKYTIIDNDAASVVVTTAATQLSSGMTSTTGTVALGTQPSGSVTVTMTASNANYITFNPVKVTFTEANWNKPQNFTLTGNLNAVAGSQANVNIYGKASGGEYNNVQSNTIAMNLLKVPQVQNFAYTGKVQSVSLPAGKYKLEVWGAQGGSGGHPTLSSNYPGGKGGYATGIITLATATNVYVYVGGAGSKGYLEKQINLGGFNGGGASAACTSTNKNSGSGGGASDIRIGKDSLYARAIVAGGGGGGGNHYWYTGEYNGTGGAGGGINGENGHNNNSNGIGIGGTASSGAAFGVGATSETNSCMSGAGGGGGWYGGRASATGRCVHTDGAGGGSGYVYTSSTYTNYPAGCLLNSNYYLGSAQTIQGTVSTMPSTLGGTETGHAGNGYARITLVQ
ncbi:MAG: hypothetical protein IJ165_10635 [Proteobacteria bacterium]|nr:hypothetical protein [Pseudomonadota bacterium]